jgi:Protein of unknown function (DUF2997)
MNKTIEITISPKGETKIETKGFSGAECRLASQFVEQVLGKQTSEQMTGEFYRGEQQVDQDLRQSS